MTMDEWGRFLKKRGREGQQVRREVRYIRIQLQWPTEWIFTVNAVKSGRVP